MTNLELYKIFAIVAKEENLTRASEILYISQPAVTKHIKNLEEALHTKLFIRSNHGIILTKEGKKIYDEIKEPMDKMFQLDKKYSRKGRDINFGTHSTILTKILGECISKYYKQSFYSKINTFNLDNEEMLCKLKNKELDIVFSKKMMINYDKKKIKFIKLGYWQDVLIANDNSKWKERIITKEDLKNEEFYMPRRTSETVKNFFHSIQCDYEEFRKIRHITYRAIVEILKDINGIGLVTKEFLEKEIKQNKMIILNTEFKIEPVEYGIYINVDNRFKELNKLIEIIETTIKK